MIRTILVFILACGLTFSLKDWARKTPREQAKKVYIPPPTYLKHMVFGYKEAVSNSLWIRYLQDLDVCGKTKVTVEKPVIRRSKKQLRSKDLDLRDDFFKRTNATQTYCQNSWSFRILDTITILTPRFRLPYAIGATALSVLLGDVEGAKTIFLRGAERFPNDWSILYRAAYHFLYEVKDLGQAAHFLERAAMHGAPIWVTSLATRLYTQAGQIELGLRALESHKQVVTEPYQKKWIQKKIDRIKKVYLQSKKNKRK